MAEALVDIGSGKRLLAPAGGSYGRCLEDGMPPGGVTSAYRDPKRQQELYELYLAGKGNFALPPSKSEHCKGLALDLGVEQREWMKKHGESYGWFGVANEAWHFNYVASGDKKRNESKEEDMPDRKWFNRTTDFDLSANKWTRVKINNEGDVSVAFGAADPVTANAFVRVRGLPKGEQAQIRFYIDEVKNGKTRRVNTLGRSVNETTGTDGDTFFRTDVITGLKSYERLRVEVWVPGNVTKARVVEAGADALVWN